VTGAGGRYDIHVQAFFAQARDRRACKLGGAAAACSGIDDGEETVFHSAGNLLPTVTV
jgi:hypothetical protein